MCAYLHLRLGKSFLKQTWDEMKKKTSFSCFNKYQIWFKKHFQRFSKNIIFDILLFFIKLLKKNTKTTKTTKTKNSTQYPVP
jgi:hypothetical protein